MGRSPCCEKAGLKRGKWSAEEDEKLVNYIKVNGEGSWRSLPTNAGLLRCGKSCRLRWINYLRSDVKRGNFTPQEDETIVKLHNTLGNRWSLIAGHLPGRTDNEIKNYWHTRLTRKIYSYRFVGESTLSAADMAKMVTKTKQKLGRSSNAAAKKHGEQAAGSKPKITSAEQAPSSDCLPLAHAVPADPFGKNDEGKSANLIDTVSSCNTLSTEGWPDALLQSPDDGHEMLGPLNEVDDEILMYLKYFLDDERHGIIMNTNKDFCGGWSSNLDL